MHLKAKLSSLGTGTPNEQNSDLLKEGWLYCLKKGQARTPKLPHFDWTGYYSSMDFCCLRANISYPAVYLSQTFMSDGFDIIFLSFVVFGGTFVHSYSFLFSYTYIYIFCLLGGVGDLLFNDENLYFLELQIRH